MDIFKSVFFALALSLCGLICKCLSMGCTCDFEKFPSGYEQYVVICFLITYWVFTTVENIISPAATTVLLWFWGFVVAVGLHDVMTPSYSTKKQARDFRPILCMTRFNGWINDVLHFWLTQMTLSFI